MLVESRITPSQQRRRGLVSVVALVTLLLIGLIGFALVRVSMARRGAVRAEERTLQAAWLADAGVERARARLRAEPAYTGETWEIPADELGGRGPGQVVIQIEPASDATPNRRSVRVQADFPVGSLARARRSRSVIVEVRPPAAEVPQP